MKWAKSLSMAALLLVAMVVPVVAQNGRITGTVADSATGQPVVGAAVSVAGLSLVTTTAGNGQYSLGNVPAGARQVTVARIGYSPATKAVVVVAGETAALSFQLAPQAIVLNEVVAVGYGTQRRRDLTGAVASVTTEALERTPIISIDQLMQGTGAGVQVSTASSAPGGGISVRIRGTASITGNSEPLYVIDGFPIENDINGAALGGRDRTVPANPLSALNPNDVESIQVLKDASATAIYGARGANGVVIITTKQGRGTRPSLSVDYYTGAQTVAKKYDLLGAKDYMAYANAYVKNSDSLAALPFPNPDTVTIDTDWQDEIFRSAGLQNFQLTLRGASQGANITRYALSGGFNQQDGIVVGSGFQRMSGRLNVTQSVGSRLELGGNMTASRARSRQAQTDGQQNRNAGAVSAALQYSPNLPVRRLSGPDSGSYSLQRQDIPGVLDPPDTPNPVSLAQEVSDSLADTRLLGNVYADYTILEGLRARVNLGADYADRWRYTYYPRTTLRGMDANGDAQRDDAVTLSLLNDNTLTYTRNFSDKHDITLLAGYTRQSQDVDGSRMSNSNFVSDITGYYDIGAGTQEGGPGVSSRHTRWTMESILGRINYTLLNRYLFTLTGRRDGSSRFGTGNKWGFFPAAAFAWRASEETFLRQFDAIDDLKFRASYGVAGNPSIRPYQSLARLNDQGYSFNGGVVAGYYPIAVGNPDLSWESTTQLDLGADVALWDRLTLTFDWYKKRTEDLLLEVELPLEVGFTTALQNLGVIENKGFEVDLGLNLVNPNRRGDFALRTNLTFARNKNKVVDLGGSPEIFAQLLTSDYNLPGTVIKVGEPIGVFYGFRSLGIIRDTAEANAYRVRNFGGTRFFRPGEMKIADINGDSVITLGDRTIIGDPTPDFTFGVSLTAGWKSLELSGVMNGVQGNKILNINRIRTEGNPRSNIIADRFFDAWSPTNTDAKYARIGENPNQVGPNNFTTNLLEDGSYMRLRSVTLSYVLPRSFIEQRGFSNARLYVTGSNLFTLTDYSGFNPDVSSQGVGNLNRGLDIGAYPLARSVTLGVSFTY
jgi:TonB-dependent starch-binding outer membrane protein SusC